MSKDSAPCSPSPPVKMRRLSSWLFVIAIASSVVAPSCQRSPSVQTEPARDPGGAENPQRKAREIVAEASELLGDRSLTARAFLNRVREAESIYSQDPVVQHALGFALEATNDLEAAAVHYRAAMLLAPAWKDPVFGLADVRLQQDRREEAGRLYRDGLALKPATESDERLDNHARHQLDRIRGGFVDLDAVLRWRRVVLDRGPRVRRKIDLRIVFAAGSAELPADRKQIDVLLKALQHPNWGREPIVLRGYAGPDEPESERARLAEHRAKAVRGYLLERHPSAKVLIDWTDKLVPVLGRDGEIDPVASSRVELLEADRD